MPLDPDYLQKVSSVLVPYGPDGVTAYSKGGLNILRCAFHTTKTLALKPNPTFAIGRRDHLGWPPRQSRGPHRQVQRRVVEQLLGCLNRCGCLRTRGPSCLAELIGDWALSIWNPGDRSVILAKDPIGVRHLYYSLDGAQLTWCSILDPLFCLVGIHLRSTKNTLPAGCHSFPPFI